MWVWLARLFGKTQTVDRTGLVSPGGLEVEVSTAPAQTTLPKPTDRIRIVKASTNPRTYDCGHTGPDRFSIDLYGLESEPFTDRKKCPNCRVEEAKSVVIRCALCGLPILPGESVAVYDERNELPYKAVAYKQEAFYLGCLRWDCCPSGGFYAGTWTGVSFEPAFEDSATAAEEAFTTGRTVIGNN